jgi:hypothetical protein
MAELQAKLHLPEHMSVSHWPVAPLQSMSHGPTQVNFTWSQVPGPVQWIVQPPAGQVICTGIIIVPRQA